MGTLGVVAGATCVGVWAVALGCGSRTGFLQDLGAGDASGSSSGAGSSSGGGSGGASGSGSGSGSGGSSGGGVAESGVTCASGESLCNGVCVNEQTDANNCGGCGLACSLPCASGRCVERLTSGGAYAVAVDSTNVYWTTSATPEGSVMSIPKNGGTPVALQSGGGGGAGIAVDATHVYWTVDVAGTVMKVPIGGGAPITLASGQSSPFGIAVDAANVYWTTFVDDGTVMSVPIGGGTLVTLAIGQSNPMGITSDATNVYWADFGTGAKNYSDGAVMAVPIGGGAPTTLATGAYAACVAVNATDLFWNWDTIAKLPLQDGGLSTTLSTIPGGGLALDSTQIYWVPTGGPVSLPLDGGTPTVLATGFAGALLSIAVDATSVYFTSLNGGVFKITPK
jgi:hypothetical protein